MDGVDVGDQVIARVSGTERYGVVKFVGTTDFSDGQWIGVELEEKVGKNDGTVNGKFYFSSKPKHGLFLRAGMVTRVHEAPVSRSSRASKKGPENSTAEVPVELPGAELPEPPDLQLLRAVLRHFSSGEVQESSSEQLVEQIVVEMEKRVWSKMEAGLQSVVEGAVEKAVSSISATQKEVRRLSLELATLKDEHQAQVDEVQVDPGEESSDEIQVFSELEASERPSTYSDAVAQLGGHEAIQVFQQRSQELVWRYNLDPELRDLLLGFDGRLSMAKPKFQPYVDDLQELMELHQQHLTSFQKMIRRLARRSGGRAVNPQLKGEERSRAKAQFKHSEGEAIKYFCLTDILRDTIEYSSIKDMYAGLDLINEDHEAQIIEINDRYQKPLPDGYRDIQLALRYKNLVCELQLNTWHMLQVKQNEGHVAFEVHRELLAAVGQQDAGRCQRTLKWALEILGQNAQEELQRILNNGPFLHQAASSGQASIVNLLIKSRADVHLQQEASGRTALHESLANGHQGASWALLCNRADPKARCQQNDLTPMMDALLRLRVKPSESLGKMVCYLAEQVGGEELQRTFSTLNQVMATLRKPSSEILFAAADGDLEKTQRCLENWADPCSRSERGETALHLLLRRSERASGPTSTRLKSFKLLLEMRASPDAIDQEGRSVLGDAIRCKNVDAMLWLMKHGCTVGQQKLSDRVDPGELSDFLPLAKAILACRDGSQFGDLSIEYLKPSLTKEELHGMGFTLPELLVAGFQFHEVKNFYADVGMKSEEDLLQAVLNLGLEPKDVGRRCLVQSDFLQRHLKPRKIRTGDLVEFDENDRRYFGTVQEVLGEQLYRVNHGEGERLLDAQQLNLVPLYRASPALQADHSVVSLAVQRLGRSLSFANDELKGDQHLVRAAVQSDGLALEFAAQHLREEKDVVLAAVRADGHALQFARAFQDDPQVVLAAIKSRGSALQFASVKLRSHSSFVRSAIVADGSAMQWALGSWAGGTTQHATVMMAVRSRMAYKHAPIDLQEAEDVAAKAVEYGLPRQELSPAVRDSAVVVEAEKKRLEQAQQFRSRSLELRNNCAAQKEHLEKAVTLDGADASTWMLLANLGGGTVESQCFSTRSCLAKAAEVGESAEIWWRLGLQGGGMVAGQFICEKSCFERSLTLERSTRAWCCLGTCGGGQVGDKILSPKECFERALQMEQHSAAWIGLGRQGGGTIKGQLYEARACFEAALEMDPDNAEAWLRLARAGGGHVGVLKTFRDMAYCACQAVMKRPSAESWAQLGKAAGGAVNGQHYSAAECFAEALQERNVDQTPELWVALAIALSQQRTEGVVDGRCYGPKQCLAEAFALDSNYAPAWLRMGMEGGTATMNATTCLVKAVELDSQSSQAWLQLGKIGGGQVAGTKYTQRNCMVQSLRLDMKNAEAWHQLGLLKGGMEQDARQCLERSLDLDDLSAQCWHDLGKNHGGSVKGVVKSQQQCFERSLELDSSNAAFWLDAGILGSCQVHGRSWSPLECFQKCLELDDSESLAWISFGLLGGGSLQGRSWSKVECCAQALEINEFHALAWLTVGLEGGGNVRGRFWYKKECFEKSLDINEKRGDAWRNLGLEGGGLVQGTFYSSNECQTRAEALNEHQEEASEKEPKVG